MEPRMETVETNARAEEAKKAIAQQNLDFIVQRSIPPEIVGIILRICVRQCLPSIQVRRDFDISVMKKANLAGGRSSLWSARSVYRACLFRGLYASDSGSIRDTGSEGVGHPASSFAQYCDSGHGARGAGQV